MIIKILHITIACMLFLSHSKESTLTEDRDGIMYEYYPYQGKKAQEQKVLIELIKTKATMLKINVLFNCDPLNEGVEYTYFFNRNDTWEPSLKRWSMAEEWGRWSVKQGDDGIITLAPMPSIITRFYFYDKNGKLLNDKEFQSHLDISYKNKEGKLTELDKEILQWKGIPNFDDLFNKWHEKIIKLRNRCLRNRCQSAEKTNRYK